MISIFFIGCFSDLHKAVNQSLEERARANDGRPQYILDYEQAQIASGELAKELFLRMRKLVRENIDNKPLIAELLASAKKNQECKQEHALPKEFWLNKQYSIGYLGWEKINVDECKFTQEEYREMKIEGDLIILRDRTVPMAHCGVQTRPFPDSADDLQTDKQSIEQMTEMAKAHLECSQTHSEEIDEILDEHGIEE